MSITNGYCTEQDIRDQVSDPAFVVDAGRIERAVNSASRGIERYCGRRFWADVSPVAKTYRPRYSDHVFVDDISSATGLVVATDDDGDGTYETTWAAADFDLEPRNTDTDTPFAWWQVTALDTRSFPVHARRAVLRVSARFGWSAVPEDVHEGAILYATALLSRSTAPLGIAGFDGFGPVRISRAGDPDVARLLDPFVRASIPER